MREGWEVKKLGELIENVKYPTKVPKRSFASTGDYPIVSQERKLINGYWSDEDNVFNIQKPVVIFGDHTQNLKYIDFDFVVGADGVKILQPCQVIYTKYLYYYLIANPIKGLGYARHFRILKDISICFPISIPEQKRIVAILDAAFEGIDQAIANTQKNLANAQEMFESYLNNIFSQKGDGWKTLKLKKITYRAGRIGWKGLTKKEYTKEGPLFLSVHSLNHGQFVDFRDAFHISRERYDESPEIMLKPDDVLLCKDGAGIGKVGIVGELPDSTTINSSLLLIRAYEDLIPKFLFYSLVSPSFQRIAKERIEGATTPHLYQRDIAEFAIPLPTIQKQKEVVSESDKLYKHTQHLQSLYTKKLTALKELKQSLLQKAFAGELTADMADQHVLEAAE